MMQMAYENQRVNYNRILAKYRDYLNLYKAINNGSMEGVTSFADFYMHFTYYSRYVNGAIIGENR